MLIEVNVFLHSHLISLFIAPMHWPMLVVGTRCTFLRRNLATIVSNFDIIYCKLECKLREDELRLPVKLCTALPLLVVSGVCWKWSWCEASVTRHLQLISVLSLLTVVMLLLVAPGLDTR